MRPRHLPQPSTYHGRPAREPHDEDDLRYGLADIQRGARTSTAETPRGPRRRLGTRFPRGWYQELERLV